MCEYPLCLELKESLDAAFHGKVYNGAESIAEWGRAVVVSLHNRHGKLSHQPTLIWHIAHCNLHNITMNCPCQGLAEAILRNPEAFLRTTLILASRCPSCQQGGRSVVFH
jgi:hypothetical protein